MQQHAHAAPAWRLCLKRDARGGGPSAALLACCSCCCRSLGGKQAAAGAVPETPATVAERPELRGSVPGATCPSSRSRTKPVKAAKSGCPAARAAAGLPCPAGGATGCAPSLCPRATLPPLASRNPGLSPVLAAAAEPPLPALLRALHAPCAAAAAAASSSCSSACRSSNSRSCWSRHAGGGRGRAKAQHREEAKNAAPGCTTQVSTVLHAARCCHPAQLPPAHLHASHQRLKGSVILLPNSAALRLLLLVAVHSI